MRKPMSINRHHRKTNKTAKTSLFELMLFSISIQENFYAPFLLEALAFDGRYMGLAL